MKAWPIALFAVVALARPIAVSAAAPNNAGSFRSYCAGVARTGVTWAGVAAPDHAFTLHLVGYPNEGHAVSGSSPDGQTFVRVSASFVSRTSTFTAFVTDDTSGTTVANSSTLPACPVTEPTSPATHSPTPSRTAVPTPTRTALPSTPTTSHTASTTASTSAGTPTPTPTPTSDTSSSSPPPASDTATAAVALGGGSASGGSLSGVGLPAWVWAATIGSVAALIVIGAVLIARHRREPLGPDADIF